MKTLTFSRDIKTIKKNHRKYLEEKIIVSEIKNSLDGLNNRMEMIKESK